MHPVRKQRLIIVMTIVIGVAIASSLIFFALGENMDHFYMPADIKSDKAEVGQKMRVGGLVKEGSVIRSEDSLEVKFTLIDNTDEIVVSFEGILPDLFREGQGIIAIGRLSENYLVVAEEVLAKHDENYMPPEIQESLEKAGHPGKKTDY